GSSGERESADHGPANHEVHFSHGRRRSLPLQNFKVIAVIRLRLTRIRIALLERFGDFFSDRTSPSAIRVLPRQAVMFTRRADNSLRVLVYLRIIVLFLGVLMLVF